MVVPPTVMVSKKFKVENGLLMAIGSEVEDNTNNNTNLSSSKDAYILVRAAHKNNSKVYFPQVSGFKGELNRVHTKTVYG